MNIGFNSCLQGWVWLGQARSGWVWFGMARRGRARQGRVLIFLGGKDE